MNPINDSTQTPSPQPDRYFPILLIEALLLATGAVYYFWTCTT
jgi:hypothetical protein